MDCCSLDRGFGLASSSGCAGTTRGRARRSDTWICPVFPSTDRASSVLARPAGGGSRLRQFAVSSPPDLSRAADLSVASYFGGPFFYGCGAGWGFNPYWWPTCNVFWSWGLGYNPPFYAYGPGYYVPAQSEPPLYWYGEDRRDLPQLYLKDGTVLTVTDYWVVDGEIHFKIVEERGAKSVEHVIAFDELDLQRTIDVATQRGFRFVLRNEPLEHYLENTPEATPPVGPPHEN